VKQSSSAEGVEVEDESARLTLLTGMRQLADEFFEVYDLVDVELKITVEVWTDAGVEDFGDDREQVVERANGLEGRQAWRTDDATRGGQSESIFNDRQWDTAIIETCGEKTIVETDSARGFRRAAIRVENFADVIPFGDLHDGLSEFQP
jgi:hypothetical protein